MVLGFGQKHLLISSISNKLKNQILCFPQKPASSFSLLSQTICF